MTSLADARKAVECGADAVGFIFYRKSPRYIEPEAAGVISRDLPFHVLRFAVTVNATPEERAQIEEAVAPDRWQFHGDESPDDCAAMAPRRVVKAVGLPLPDGSPGPHDFPVSGILLDRRSACYGGTGEVIDWQDAAAWCRSSRVPTILSGGLTPENVSEAIAIVQPDGIDVCSGVEQEKGVKDHQRLREFIAACRQH